MSRMIYDCTDKDLLYKTSNHTALGMDGHIHMQVNKSCSIDMNNGMMHQFWRIVQGGHHRYVL